MDYPIGLWVGFTAFVLLMLASYLVTRRESRKAADPTGAPASDSHPHPPKASAGEGGDPR